MSLLKRKADRGLVKVEQRALPAISDLEREFAQLYETLLPQLVAAARAQDLDDDDAFDVAQSTMQEIWPRWKDLRTDGRGPAYFFKAVANQIALFKRRESHAPSLGTQYLSRQEPVDARAVTDAWLEREEFLSLVAKRSGSLPERCRQSFRLVCEAELSYAAAAEVMGITPDAVRHNYVRALAVLEPALIEAGYGRGSLSRWLPGPTQHLLSAAGEATEQNESEREETP